MVSFYLSKTDGAIKLVDIFQQPAGGPFIIEDDSSGKWFYHRVQWVDMDGDGDKDVVTCHAKEPIIGNHILRDTFGDGLMYESTIC